MICIGCGRQPHQLHHVITRQQLKHCTGVYTRLVKDARNLVPVCFQCHGAHHNRTRPLNLRELPNSVFEFAPEVMGVGPAYEYLRRYYDGEDPRLERLLDDNRRAA